MNPKITILLLVASVLVLVAPGCTKKTEIGNSIYIANAGEGNTSERITVAETGASIDITARAATVVDNNISVSFSVVEDALNKYNETWGTEYKILPEKYYSLSATTAQITAGSAFASPVSLHIDALDADLPDTERYAIPVQVNSAGGGLPVLQSAKTLIVLIDRVVITTVVHLRNANARTDLKTPLTGLRAWTFEWRSNLDAMNTNNRALMMGYGEGTEVYMRFGDVVIRPSQLQVKFGSYGQFSPDDDFQANRWYHYALVYDGSTAKWYADGRLILNVALNASFNFDNIQFGNNNTVGMVNEMRFWSVPLSSTQIINNMYSVNPSASGLEGYWKCNDGTGRVLKDATSKGNDMNITGGTVTWRTGIKMPAE